MKEETLNHQCVVPKNIQLLTPWMAVGGSQRPTFLKERVHQSWNFQRDYNVCGGGGVQTKRNTHVKDMLIAIFRNNIHSWSSCPSNCIWNFEITNITKQYGFSSCQYQLHYCTRHASSM